MISKKELLATWQPAREKHLASCATLVAKATEQVRKEFAAALANAAATPNGGSVSISISKTNRDADYDAVIAEVRDAGYTVIVSNLSETVYEIVFDDAAHPVCVNRAADAKTIAQEDTAKAVVDQALASRVV